MVLGEFMHLAAPMPLASKPFFLMQIKAAKEVLQLIKPSNHRRLKKCQKLHKTRVRTSLPLAPQLAGSKQSRHCWCGCRRHCRRQFAFVPSGNADQAFAFCVAAPLGTDAAVAWSKPQVLCSNPY